MYTGLICVVEIMCVWKVSMKCLIYMGKELRKFVGLYGGSSLQETCRKCLENPKSFREMSGKCPKMSEKCPRRV